jgi:hypothetical protein
MEDIVFVMINSIDVYNTNLPHATQNFLCQNFLMGWRKQHISSSRQKKSLAKLATIVCQPFFRIHPILALRKTRAGKCFRPLCWTCRSSCCTTSWTSCRCRRSTGWGPRVGCCTEWSTRNRFLQNNITKADKVCGQLLGDQPPRVPLFLLSPLFPIIYFLSPPC